MMKIDMKQVCLTLGWSSDMFALCLLLENNSRKSLSWQKSRIPTVENMEIYHNKLSGCVLSQNLAFLGKQMKN